MSGYYNMTLEQVEKLLFLKNDFEEVVEKVMLSQCHRECPYATCLYEEESKQKQSKHSTEHSTTNTQSTAIAKICAEMDASYANVQGYRISQDSVRDWERRLRAL